MRHRAIVLFLVSAALVAASPAISGNAPGGALGGTFLQLSEAQDSWTDREWRDLFSSFESLGLSELLVQWSVLDGSAFYPSRSEPVRRPHLPTLLALADEAGMDVWVGLAHDSAYWSQIDRAPELVEVYLQRRRLRSLAVARELVDEVSRHPSFRGWYLPEEIDDVHWLEEAPRRILAEHLARTCRDLRELTPETPVAVSGFTNAHADPSALEAFWHEILAASALDRLLFQDGIGARKLELGELPLYLEAVSRAAHATRSELKVVVELFAQTRQEPFRAEPAPAERVRRQIAIASEVSSNGLSVAFSVPDYMTPRAGEAAEKLMTEMLVARR